MPESGSSRRETRLPPLPPLRRREGDFSFPDAVQRTSRAVTNIGEAFQSTARPSGPDVVDLTLESLPAENGGEGRPHSQDRRHSHFISVTTHPQDSQQPVRGLSNLHQPIFGYQPTRSSASFPLPQDPGDNYNDSLARARARRVRLPNITETSRARARANRDRATEQSAIRQQQENHRTWQETQERARRLQEQQDLEQLASLSSSPLSIDEDSIFGDSTASSPDTMPSTEQIEAVDLTAVEDNTALADALSKQREDAIAAQKPNTSTENGRTTLTAYKCPICMDNLKNATTTSCGHLFCHQCIVDTLNWSAAQQRQDTGRRAVKGVCPVCRKSLKANDGPGASRNLVPLELKLLTSLKRKRDEKGKGRADDDFLKVKGGSGKKLKREMSQDVFNAWTNPEY